jgi:hypothetical protein
MSSNTWDNGSRYHSGNCVQSGLESSVRSLKGSVNESRAIIETKTSNIVSINSIFRGINNSITGLDGRVKVLEEILDYND